MIEGLKVTIPGRELREICLKQAEYHRQRAAVYAEQLKNLQASQVEGMQYSGGDPKKAMADRQDKHTSSVAEMEFTARYLDLNENYLLGATDLHKLGIYKDSYGAW